MRKTVAAAALVALSGAAVVGFAIGRSTAATGPKSYFAVLNTGQEIPQGNPAPTGDAIGVAHFVLHPDRTICTNMTVTGLDGGSVTGAHIHEGRVGENGGIVINLASGSTVWRGDCGLAGEKLSRAEVDLLNQRRLYVNVHTTGFGDGEVRGQIGKL